MLALTALLVAAAPIDVLVIVPLCDGAQLACGSGGLGDAREPSRNLYWGARFGAARFLEDTGDYRPAPSPAVTRDDVLDERHLVRPAGAGERPVRVTLLAYDGARIDHALGDFFDAVAGHRADLVVWMGHDRLMDVAAPALLPADAPASAAVLACTSETYFKPSLDALGARSVALTRTLMAPEGYLLHALVRNVARHGVDERAHLRRALVDAYARYQRITPAAAASVFARLP